jgi:hypothetical protein
MLIAYHRSNRLSECHLTTAPDAVVTIRMPCAGARPQPLQSLHEDAQEIRAAHQDLRPLRAAVRMAQEVGARLGAGQILLGTVPACSAPGPVTTTVRLTVVLRPSRATTVAVTAYTPAVEKL